MRERGDEEWKREDVVYTGSGFWFYFLFVFGRRGHRKDGRMDVGWENDQDDSTEGTRKY